MNERFNDIKRMINNIVMTKEQKKCDIAYIGVPYPINILKLREEAKLLHKEKKINSDVNKILLDEVDAEFVNDYRLKITSPKIVTYDVPATLCFDNTMHDHIQNSGTVNNVFMIVKFDSIKIGFFQKALYTQIPEKTGVFNYLDDIKNQCSVIME
ncbi:MAG: hypothetical protein FWG20_07000 [Candidatus Cloacimonetes bacterium]|nr:hypothetical protein [Candidatus Cloacimonadota bacterium]